MMFSKSCYKILESIYNNPSIRLNELIKKSNVSVETAKTRLNELLSLNVITEKRIKSGKRTLIRNFCPNFKSEEGLSVFSLIELEKKHEFFKKNPKLMGPFKDLVRELNKIDIILIFGSFAKFSQTKDSDLDILFLSKTYDKEKIKKVIERSFITFNHEISPRIDIIKNFNKNKILQNIKQNHVIIKGVLKFIKNYYS